MLCRVLGPLEVRAAGDWTGVSAPKWRALLAVLLLSPGQVVSAGQLADEVWGDDPPPGARKLVSGYVAALRRLTGDPDGRVLVTRAPGYRLMVAPADLDVSRFEDLVAAARGALAAGDDAGAAGLAGEALALWRGPALADVPRGPLVAAAAARLEELRVDARELRAEAGIRGGRGAGLVAELRQLTAGYPLRERFWQQLMRALQQAGRPAEALEVYARARKVLAEELGADPGPGLQQLHRRLLAGDPPPAARAAAVAVTSAAAAVTAAPPAVAAAAPAVRRQLPAAAAHFAGRAGELAALTSLLEARAELPGAVVISAIDGMPGVGKTALAVQAGHLLADRFPDRQLFADLHGHTPGRQPADPAGVLAALLAADGVDPRYLPAGLDGRAAMWRDRMAGRRALLILDNAASSTQVTPLLPGTPGCLVLITSRRFLGDLPATLDIPLDILPPADAQAMFTSLAPRAARDPDQVTELAALCGHLPLAISLLGRLLTRHPSWTMTDLITETRARLLTVTAENRTIAAAFQASYQDLDTGRQRFFRHLGLHPGPDIDPYAAAALARVPPGEAAGHLDALHSDRLLEEPVPRRYRMHDLIRQYARTLADDDSGADREQATDRLLDYYQHTAQAADVHLTRHTRPTAAAPVAGPAAAPGLPDRDQARAWMTAEHANLAGCIDDALARSDHARVTGLTAAIAARLRSDGPWPRAVTLHAAAARAAQHLGDQPGHANALLNLGDLQYLTSDIPGAADTLEQARDLYRGIGDQLGEANALYSLGVARQQSTDGFAGATDLLEQSLGIFRDIGDRLGEANALSSLGIVRRLAGDYSGATGPLEQALDILRDIGNQPGEANALRGLAAVRQLTGDYPGATSLLKQALDISRRNADRIGEAYALFGLGAVRQLTGDYPGATLVLEQALGIHRRIGSRRGEAYAFQYLGDTRRAVGDLPGATGLLAQSLDICREIGDRLGEAYALLSLGQVRRAVGDFPGATGLLAQSLDIYRRLGDRGGEAEALIETGAVHLAQGDPLQGRPCYQRALELARATGARLEEARALEGIGKCATQICEASTADSALQQALEIYRRLGTADAARLAAEIDASLDGAADTAQVPSRVS
jgi:DNA-binding SARP family transcriptional activator/tetratricopeptide (TPR) repeat protein